MYSIGGRPSGEGAGTHAIDDVYYAAVNPDGSVGSWTATTFLPAKRAVEGAYAYNDRMYVWGGWDESYTTWNTCYYAAINPDGSLGTWTTSSVTIPDAAGSVPQMDSFGRGVLGYANYVYVLGGERNDGSLSDQVYVSAIDGAGDFGAWQTTTALPFADWFHGVAIVEGATETYIYQVGGNHGGTSESHIFKNTINSDGTVGATWDQVGDLPTAIYELGIAVTGDTIFAIGGLNGATPQDAVYKLKVDLIDGLPQSIATTTPLPEARARVAAVGYNVGGTDYILVAGGGGYAGTDPVLDSVVYAEIPVILGSGTWMMYE